MSTSTSATFTFGHHAAIWKDFPALVPVVLHVDGLHPNVNVGEPVARYTTIATDRLVQATESEFSEIQAWRRAFSAMGLKPTQYRCASESLLRRLRKEGSLPSIHPLIDLCNAISVAFAVPVAAIDLAHVREWIEVRHATGDERYQTFGGDIEHPAQGEVIFADAAGQAHARRWTNRQSGLSAISAASSDVLIVSEALHPSAPTDMPQVLDALRSEIAANWGVTGTGTILTAEAPTFTVTIPT